MKKLVILSDESVLAGCAKSGVGEVVDSLANVLTNEYDVSIICPNGKGTYLKLAGVPVQYDSTTQTCRLFKVTYFLLSSENWEECAASLIDELRPDIFHNFSSLSILHLLTVRPAKCIYTIDRADYISGQENYLSEYDNVTTVSETYAQELLNNADALSGVLSNIAFCGITNGILTQAFAPEKGLFIAEKYSRDNFQGKAVCKQRLMTSNGIAGDPCIYLMMCRLVKEKGIDSVISSVHTIRDNGGFTIIVGTGDEEYESQLSTLTSEDGVLWVNNPPSPMQAVPMLAGADFYLSPSLSEPCGLMPMTAARFGCIPITTLNGGLADNMDEKIAIIINDGELNTALIEAAELYKDELSLNDKRAACMNRDFSWDTRKRKYIEVYES